MAADTDDLGRTIPDGPEDVSVAQSSEGVVATSNAHATRVAAEVLEDGGNAVDAAVALHMVLSVTEPDSTGLGAGGYVMYYDAEDEHTYFLDQQTRASRHAHPELLQTSNVYDRGLAAGVPGVVRGWDVALKRWGTRYFDDLAGPAIDLARNGHEVDRELSLRIHQTQDTLGENAREVYLDENGEPYQPGDLLVQEDKADALELIAAGGSEAFYQGPIAEAAAEYIQDLGGVVTAGDFARYYATVEAPTWITYRGHRIALNPNQMGAQSVAGALKILERFDFGEMGPGSADRYHLQNEALRHADYEAQRYFADPEFVDRPWQGALTEEFIDDKVDTISLDEVTSIEEQDPWEYQVGDAYRTAGHSTGDPGEPADPIDPANDPPESDGDAEDDDAEALEALSGTNHFTVADRHGNVLASTSTLGVGWVGGKMVPGYGFMLNVTGSYYGGPGAIDEVESDKRPWSNMSPTFVFDGHEPILTVGSPGATTMAPLNVLTNVIDHGMSVAEAIAHPRVDGTSWEDGVSEDVLAELEDRGWPMSGSWTDRGAVQTYARKPVPGRAGEPVVGGDPRRDGVAAAAGEDVRGPPAGRPGSGRGRATTDEDWGRPAAASSHPE
ncbi:gamma-glutamyltransferase family protein [Natrononativus amylolyticus]|uniref:gamma-glutamyltransferase family protein n=1 Tax=Natrononativus amylolyticus TaxID=2963434 RepID=UPI0020CEFCED|nr:gamma-glutamyltransferase [Natrononativus amylolyticus]